MPVAPRKSALSDLAKGCALVNQCALPGLGTFAAGRRVAGIAQMTLALTGFALTMIWAWKFVRTWLATRQLPQEIDRSLLIGVLGAVLFLAAWCWALATSLQILRAARKTNV